ncbi:MAG: apolipoprotein N-acyltransferase [Labilithrix sp.]
MTTSDKEGGAPETSESGDAASFPSFPAPPTKGGKTAPEPATIETAPEPPKVETAKVETKKVEEKVATPKPAAAKPVAPVQVKKGKKAKAVEGPDVLVRGWLAPAGAFLAGCLSFTAFAGLDIWPLAFVALVPLYLSLIGQTPKRAAWIGLASGFAMCMGGFYWLANMLKTFSGFGMPMCLFFTSFICVYQGGRIALTGWLFGRATQRGWPAPIVFVAAFATSELVFPLLFPWYYGGCVHKIATLLQLADIGGPILVTTGLVIINVAIAEVLRAKLAGVISITRGVSNEEKLRAVPDQRVIGAGVIALLVMVLYGAIRISMTNARVDKAEEATVGYVQGNMGLMAKRENPGEGLRRHKDLTSELKKKGIDFVVWSETSATFPTREDVGMKPGYFAGKFTASLGMPAIFGAVLYRPDREHPENEKWFNTALATNAKGEIAEHGRYDKQFLLMFGEYLPLSETFPILHKWSPHSGRFSPGTSLEPVDIELKGVVHKVSVLICYEDVLPSFTNRAVSHADPELIVNMTNDAWFGDSTEPWEHLALAKFRAIEHRRFLVRSTNSGVSAVIDPNGGLVEGEGWHYPEKDALQEGWYKSTTSTPFRAEAHLAKIRWLRGGTVYEAIGDGPWYLVGLGLVVACFRRRKGTPAPVAA